MGLNPAQSSSNKMDPEQFESNDPLVQDEDEEELN